ncbi:hypothetical protein [Cohnella faecalis]|uniref:Uncharacterized protein n=1 Tax=Cohnella faecalis TaxID=2315694 RepID=A0A398CJI6_9BACL|nr:hypothetical protein [Cohnella faecalis]RIE02863.1 hypothetical protein D3H35_19750 [Cohnella faecalis]
MRAAIGAPINARPRLGVKPNPNKKRPSTGRKRAVKARKRRGKRIVSKKRPLSPEQPQQPQQSQQSQQPMRTYEQGYSEGLFDGGEKFVEQHHPGDLIIPDLSVEGAVAAGIQALRPTAFPCSGLTPWRRNWSRACARRDLTHSSD